MPNEVTMAIAALIVITMSLAIKHAISAHRVTRQRRIADAGARCLGRVVAIQRPFMLDECTRLYFDFIPTGTQESVRACHVTRSTADGSMRPLPPQGATVSVSYLPDRPQHAVIGKLVTG